jgi:hypothetical protein
MLDLGSTEFHLAIPSYSEPELRRLSTRLFDSWESFAGDALSLPDYSLYLQVEEGSVKGLATVGAVLATVYFGIGNYGDFISGLRTINEQLTATSEYLREHAPTVFSCPESKVTSSRQAGTLASLQRLFVKVQSGALTPDQAMQRAQVLLGEEAESLPGFLEELARAFRDCPRFHEQQKLPFNEEERRRLAVNPWQAKVAEVACSTTRFRPPTPASRRGLARVEGQTEANSGGKAVIRNQHTQTPNPSLNLTRYGKRRKPGLQYASYPCSPGLRRSPPRAG